MTTDDKEALKEFLSGVSVVLGVVVALILLVFILGNEDPDTNNSPSTEVVGKYQECDIVRLNFSNLAEYHYVLYCGKN